MPNSSHPPILFVHGAWHGGWCWEEHFVPFFTDAGFECHTMDLPQHGKPGVVKGINSLSINDYVQAVKAKVNLIGQSPILIGHSMGGIILQKYLEQYTCEKAVFLAPAPPHGILRTTMKFLAKPYAWIPLLTMNLYGLVDTASKARWAFFSDKLSDEKVDHYTDKMCSESFLAFLNMLYPNVKMGYHKSTPMLVVAAELDNIFSISDNERTASRYGAELAVIDGIGHDMMLDTGWQSVAEAVGKFIK